MSNSFQSSTLLSGPVERTQLLSAHFLASLVVSRYTRGESVQTATFPVKKALVFGELHRSQLFYWFGANVWVDRH